jgi:hypothetical protein
MNNMKKLLFLLLFSTCFLVSAQVKFSAVTEKNTYALNENIQLSFEMNVDADNFQLPKIEGFKVEGPFLMMQNYNINGRRGFLKTYKYFLTPKKMGDFTINEAQIEFGGKVYKSDPIKIKITKAVAQPQRNQQQNQYYDPFDDPFFNQMPNQRQAQPNYGEGVFIVADIDNKSPMVNQPIKVVYKIYFDPRIQIGNISSIKKPKYNGYWSQFFDANRPAVEAQYKGKIYAMAVLGSAILYPQESGIKPIEPFSFTADVEAISGRDMFGRPVYTTSARNFSSGTQNINVRDLPSKGKPIAFSGAVGNLDFKVSASKTEIKGGESLDLVVSVSGKGNLKLFSLPKPEVPNALELYDPAHKETIETPMTGMTGFVSDTYTIVPQYKGSYVIKPMEFVYFDLNTKTYKTTTSKPIVINVLEGPEYIANAKTNKKTGKKEKEKSFAENAKTGVFETIQTSDFLGSNAFYLGLLLPLVLIPIFVLYKNKRDAQAADFVGNRRKQSNRLVKKYLSEAKKQLKNKEQFYVALEKAMHNFLKAKLSIETTEMNKETIKNILLSQNVEDTLVSEFIEITENCELARYAPATQVSIQQDFDTAIRIVSELDKKLK